MPQLFGLNEPTEQFQKINITKTEIYTLSTFTANWILYNYNKGAIKLSKNFKGIPNFRNIKSE